MRDDCTSVGASLPMIITQILIAARATLILWVNLGVMPAEFVFDSIETELKRRGIDTCKIGTNGG